ncbi:MAG: YfaP family protein [Rhodocyclaceae bacterium]
MTVLVALGIIITLAAAMARAQAATSPEPTSPVPASSPPTVTPPAAEITLDAPRAGWHAPPSVGAAFTQTVNYPAASVDSRHDQADGARIRGRIAGAAKGPAQLVVNGVAMPLRVEEDGSFDRPYLFPAGSNSVEVRSADGNTRRRVQFLAHPDSATRARLRVILAWDTDHTDLDLHVIAPDGQHAWYGQRVLDNGGAIDVDVTTGYGPEIFATPAPLNGPYLVFVNYFGGHGHDEADMTVATITIVSQEGTENEKRESVQVPMRAPGELTLVKRFSYP